MDDLDRYIQKRKKADRKLAKRFDAGYEQFKIGLLLRMAREEAGVTQEEIAVKLGTKKSAISRIENHAEDIKLSTIEKFAEAIGRHLELNIVKA